MKKRGREVLILENEWNLLYVGMKVIGSLGYSVQGKIINNDINAILEEKKDVLIVIADVNFFPLEERKQVIKKCLQLGVPIILLASEFSRFKKQIKILFPSISREGIILKEIKRVNGDKEKKTVWKEVIKIFQMK